MVPTRHSSPALPYTWMPSGQSSGTVTQTVAVTCFSLNWNHTSLGNSGQGPPLVWNSGTGTAVPFTVIKKSLGLSAHSEAIKMCVMSATPDVRSKHAGLLSLRLEAQTSNSDAKTEAMPKRSVCDAIVFFLLSHSCLLPSVFRDTKPLHL